MKSQIRRHIKLKWLCHEMFRQLFFIESAQVSQRGVKFERIRENEFLRETIVTCLLGAHMGWIHE